MAGGDPMKYAYYEDMNTIAFLNLLSFKISQAKESKRKMKLQNLKSQLRNA